MIRYIVDLAPIYPLEELNVSRQVLPEFQRPLQSVTAPAPRPTSALARQPIALHF
jgi:hypothetical protein